MAGLCMAGGNKMKKLFLALGVVAMITLASCSLTKKTATVEQPKNNIATAVAADLEVSPNRINYTYEPSSKENKAGVQNVINCAVAKALKDNGDAHVLVGMEYTMKAKQLPFGLKVVEITVSGFPAKYKNFHNLPDAVDTPNGKIIIK